MTIEVLVMCTRCGRPQPPRPQCVQCGTDLPSSPVPEAHRSQQESLPVEGPVEFDLGDGRRLVVTTESLQLFGAPRPPTNLASRPVPNVMGSSGPASVPLASVRRAALAQLRTWPAIVLAMVSLGVMILLPGWLPRSLGALGVAAAVWLFVRTRYFVVRFERSDGAPAILVLGGGTAGSRRGVNAHSLWLEISAELRRRGVRVEP